MLCQPVSRQLLSLLALACPTFSFHSGLWSLIVMVHAGCFTVHERKQPHRRQV